MKINNLILNKVTFNIIFWNILVNISTNYICTKKKHNSVIHSLKQLELKNKNSNLKFEHKFFHIKISYLPIVLM